MGGDSIVSGGWQAGDSDSDSDDIGVDHEDGGLLGADLGDDNFPHAKRAVEWYRRRDLHSWTCMLIISQLCYIGTMTNKIAKAEYSATFFVFPYEYVPCSLGWFGRGFRMAGRGG